MKTTLFLPLAILVSILMAAGLHADQRAFSITTLKTNYLATSTAATCTTAPPGMVAWWAGEGNANDVLGGNNGTLQSGVTFSRGEVGQGFNLDGSPSAYVFVPASTSLNVGTGHGLTIEAWIVPTSNSSSGRPIVEYSAPHGPYGVHMWVSGSDQLFVNLVDTAGNDHFIVSDNATININIMQHVAMTYDTSDGSHGFATLYINGVVASGPMDLGIFTPKTDVDVYLGARVSAGDRFQGVEDEVQIFNRALSSTEIQAIYNAGSEGICGGPPHAPAPLPIPPPHGGLSATVFMVNERDSPAAHVADTVLRFAAQQTGAPAGLLVRVQATTTPGTESSWIDLPNESRGYMDLDNAGNQFVLNSTNYPLQNGVYFRALASAQGYSDSRSNVVGPFDLSSSAVHLPPVVLLVKRNGSLADLAFTAGEIGAPSGVALRVQSSTTPATESSWADIADGQSGHMTRSTNANYPNVFLLLANKLPAGSEVYFRVVAGLSGSIDSLSNVTGPYTLTADNPPIVTLHPPTGLSGSGTQTDPLVLPTGTFHFSADATPDLGRPASKITSLKLQIDGSSLSDSPSGPSGIDYTANAIGDHVLEAVAIDDLGATARAATGAFYIRVVPNGNTALKGIKSTAASNATVSTPGKVFTVAHSGGDWNDPSTWRDTSGNSGVPGQADLAIIGASTVRMSQDIVAAGAISLGGGTIAGPGTLDVYGTITISAGTFENATLYIASTGVCNLINAVDIQFSGTAVNFGSWQVHGSGGLKGLTSFDNQGRLNWQAPLTISPNAGLDPAASVRLLQAPSVSNSGLMSTASLIGEDGASLIASGGGNIISQGGGNVISDHGVGLIGQDGAGLIGQDGAGLIGEDGASLIASGGGNLIASGGGNFTSSRAQIRAETASSGFTQTGGEIDISSITLLGPVTLNGGTLSGSGIIYGNVTNSGGFVSPGHSAGSISISGDYTQGAQGSLIIENGGAAPNQYDHLRVTGAATLGGTLNIRDINGYTPSTLDTFSPLGFTSATGSFASISSNAQVTVTANGLLTSVNPSVPGPMPAQPLNISTRMNVLAGDNALIAGFIVTGPSGSTKKVLVRGIGPSLANFGVPGTISDPLLELHKPDGSVVTNDNWQEGDTSQIPNGFAPGDPRESVIVATLAPGNYTAVLKGAHGETGVGLAEVYDLDSTSAAQLANISTRGFVNTGDNVMIGGFIVGGSEPTKVLVRAIGPSLAAFGVQGALPATTLELHDANGAVISNEGWRNTQEAEITATTIPPSNDNEAAILATLTPGNYTAVVRGKNNTTGIGLVEAYNLQ